MKSGSLIWRPQPRTVSPRQTLPSRWQYGNSGHFAESVFFPFAAGLDADMVENDFLTVFDIARLTNHGDATFPHHIDVVCQECRAHGGPV